MSRINKKKTDQELMMSIRKATSPEETSPKQKHVRTAIVYTWDHVTSQPFWIGLKNSPFLANEIQCFKALILVHKVIRQGHPTTLPEAITEKPWLEVLPRMLMSDFRGYRDLIQAYVEFLSAKLGFHRVHPEFNGLFDYNEYVSLRGTMDPNEGYETVSELMDLQDHVDRFQRMIMASLRSSPILECRLSALVPLIEESYGIYRFITSMLRAVHRRVGSLDALEPLRKRYNSQHFMLRDFYSSGRRHQYLTSLIVIPVLGDQPPSLYDADDLPALASRPITPPNQADDNEGEDLTSELWAQHNAQQQHLEQQQQQQQNELELQQMADHHRQLQLQYQAMLGDAQMRLQQLQDQLTRAKSQYESDQALLQQYDARVRELQLQVTQGSGSQEALKTLQDELTQWKTKYEALAKLYAQLRKEHLELLQKYKELQIKTQSSIANADSLSSLQAQLNAKTLQLADLIKSRDDLKRELESKRLHTDELDQLRLAAERAQAQLREKEEEIMILQTGLDQSLLALAEMKRRSEETEQVQVMELERGHAMRLDRILDSIFLACIQIVNQAGMELEDTVHPGNVNSTIPHALSVLDETVKGGATFAQEFLKFLVGGDQSGAITSVNAFAYMLSSLLRDCKGIVHQITEENETAGERVILAGKQAASVVSKMFGALSSSQLGLVESGNRPNHVSQHAKNVASALTSLGETLDSLAGTAGALKMAKDGHDLGTVVESEMLAASRAIEEATRRLQALLSTPAHDSTPATLAVHSAILSAAMALMQAIANLIRCATLTQQEIAAHGKGSTGGSTAAFYKKHHRWTEGLISAAKAIAQTTQLLVETADGMVKGTHSMEQLVVAANEVGAATAQLVAASRVKAVDGSRTQPQLEAAAAAVVTATRLLVKAAKDAARKDVESRTLREFNHLSIHDLKTQEMEQQVQILTLEKELVAARGVLAQMRKASYQVVE
jgi:hypothetical protein